MTTATLTPTYTPAGVTPAAWGHALDAAYAKAKAGLPDIGERLDRALHLVALGNVEHAAQFGQHHYTVFSESDRSGLTTYDVHAQAPISCTCEDWERHSQDRAYACKHVVATWLYRRALEALSTDEQARIHEPSCRPSNTTVRDTVALPEAAFSLCLKGRYQGVEAQLTIRGQTPAQFRQHLQEVLDVRDQVDQVCALFDAAPADPASSSPASAAEQPTPEGWCMIHGVQMKKQTNARGSWWSHQAPDGAWCQGKKKSA